MYSLSCADRSILRSTSRTLTIRVTEPCIILTRNITNMNINQDMQSSYRSTWPPDYNSGMCIRGSIVSAWPGLLSFQKKTQAWPGSVHLPPGPAQQAEDRWGPSSAYYFTSVCRPTRKWGNA